MTEEYPKSRLESGAQDGGYGIKLDNDESLSIGDEYPDPDKDSDELDDDEEVG
jgi:hypothetical protein